MRLFRKGIVGIDIDSMEIRAVEISEISKKPKIVSIGKVSLEEKVVREGKIEDPEMVAKALRELWVRYKIKSKFAIFGVNNSDVIVRFALFPKIPEEKLARLIKFQASDYIPYTLDDVELDHSIVSEVERDGMDMYNVLLVAAQKSMLYQSIKALSFAGLSIKDIKSSTLVMDRLVPAKYSNTAVVMVNICFDGCNILIIDKGVPALARTIIFSDSINGSLRKIYKKDTDEYLEQNINRPITTEEKSKSEEMSKVVEFIAENIRASITYYYSQNAGSKIEKTYLVGPIACNKEIVEDLIKKTEVHYEEYHIETLQPYHHLYERLSKHFANGRQATEYAIAFSLALHGLEV